MKSIKLVLLIFCLLLVGSAYSQRINKIQRSGISCHNVMKPDSVKQSDVSLYRSTVCVGKNSNYVIVSYFHQYSKKANEHPMYSTADGFYSVNVYSTNSCTPIESTKEEYVYYPNNELVSFCNQYGIKDLIFYQDK